MSYRTRTYIAADWDTDGDAVEQLRKWNNSNYWGISFTDAHELTQARDSSLNCSIKASLKSRMDCSKCFVLIVGKNTKTVRSGSCQYCMSYTGTAICRRNHYVNFESYIEYECKQAIEAGIDIVVLYNAASIDRSRCPESVRYKGTHVAMKSGWYSWNYQAVRNAID